MEVKDAINVLRDALAKDEDYYYTWQCSIALAFMEELYEQGMYDQRGKVYKVADRAAENFLNLFISQQGVEA